MLPHLKVLEPEQLDQVHAASLAILDSTGLILTHDLPPYSRDVAGTALMLQHTTKHVHADPHSAEAARLHHPGTPVVYQTRSSLFEMQQGTSVWGCIERAWSMLLPALAGVDILPGAGNLDGQGCLSLPQLIMDDEWLASVKQMMQGMAVDAERLESLLLAPPPEPLAEEVVAELDRIVRHAAQTLTRVES